MCTEAPANGDANHWARDGRRLDTAKAADRMLLRRRWESRLGWRRHRQRCGLNTQERRERHRMWLRKRNHGPAGTRRFRFAPEPRLKRPVRVVHVYRNRTNVPLSGGRKVPGPDPEFRAGAPRGERPGSAIPDRKGDLMHRPFQPERMIKERPPQSGRGTGPDLLDRPRVFWCPDRRVFFGPGG